MTTHSLATIHLASNIPSRTATGGEERWREKKGHKCCPDKRFSAQTCLVNIRANSVTSLLITAPLEQFSLIYGHFIYSIALLTVHVCFNWSLPASFWLFIFCILVLLCSLFSFPKVRMLHVTFLENNVL